MNYISYWDFSYLNGHDVTAWRAQMVTSQEGFWTDFHRMIGAAGVLFVWTGHASWGALAPWTDRAAYESAMTVVNPVSTRWSHAR